MRQFTTPERIALDEIFNFGETTIDNLQSQLHTDIYDFLRKKDNLNTIIDRKIIRDRTKAKPYDSAILTKYITRTFNASKAIEQLVQEISGRFLIYIDFHFLLQ